MKKHILVIDDDRDEVDILRDALEELSIPGECTWARNGMQAIEQLRDLSPDVIFLDVNMPHMNGLECLAAIKQLPGRSDIPVVLCSTGMSQDIRKKGLQAGAAACVKKANTFTELSALLQEVLRP